MNKHGRKKLLLRRTTIRLLDQELHHAAGGVTRYLCENYSLDKFCSDSCTCSAPCSNTCRPCVA
jgi:hypothetical protein